MQNVTNFFCQSLSSTFIIIYLNLQKIHTFFPSKNMVTKIKKGQMKKPRKDYESKIFFNQS